LNIDQSVITLAVSFQVYAVNLISSRVTSSSPALLGFTLNLATVFSDLRRTVFFADASTLIVHWLTIFTFTESSSAFQASLPSSSSPLNAMLKVTFLFTSEASGMYSNTTLTFTDSPAPTFKLSISQVVTVVLAERSTSNGSPSIVT
jgi:hypothetical protein